MVSFLDNFCGLLIASILSAGILPILLLILPGLLPEFFKIKIYVFQTNFHHHIRLSCTGEFVRLHIYVTMVPSFLLEPFYAGEGGQDPDHLFGGRDEWMGTEMVDFAFKGFVQEDINSEA